MREDEYRRRKERAAVLILLISAVMFMVAGMFAMIGNAGLAFIISAAYFVTTFVIFLKERDYEAELAVTAGLVQCLPIAVNFFFSIKEVVIATVIIGCIIIALTTLNFINRS